MFKLSDYHYDLPQSKIAVYPLAKRSASRLLVLHEASIQHTTFDSILTLVNPNDLLVFNDTKVIPARLIGHKSTGGRVEVLIERILNSSEALAQLHVSKPPAAGTRLHFDQGIELLVTERSGRFFRLATTTETSILKILQTIGEIPLPPYLHRTAEPSDIERYQTIYAREEGSVAAPTAGFHFDENLLTAIKNRGIDFAYLTLHIGAGTFLPVRSEDIREHQMHAEYLQIDQEVCAKIEAARARGGRVIAVGTTSLRALETAAQTGTIQPYNGETSIFIYPGYQFNCVDALITNLHLPSSSLLMLVCAFGGYKNIMTAYQAAVEADYRFYSYGDAMWVSRLG